MDKYDWKGINDISGKDDCEKYVKNNQTIALIS